MLDAAEEAVSLTQKKTRSDLDRERLLNLALVRLTEIVGEAAARVKQEDRDRFPEIPWPQMVALRNRLIHGYDEVNFDILWQILSQDFPLLIVNLRSALRGQ